MVHTASLTTAAAAAAALLLLAAPVSAGLYSKSSPVIQLNAKTYKTLIANSNYTSIVEFYAPWCGHCKSLQPAYEKAAKSLKGLAKVAAIDCDEETNKAFCGSMGVQGFPTLKIVKPGKKVGRPGVEDYQGSRDAKGIVSAVIDKIPNHVKRIGDKGLDEWLKKDNDTAKAILFSNKGTTSALIKSLAVDFLGSISFAQIRDKEQAAVKLFGINDFPSLVLLPGGTGSIIYDGEMKKEAMSAFLSQVTPPNPDPAPPKAKAAKADKKVDKKKAQEKSSKAKSAYDKASAKHASSEATEAAASATSVVLDDDSNPTESPDPIVKGSDAPKPVPVDNWPSRIPRTTAEELERNCLGPKSKTCILVLLSTSEENKEADIEVAATALESLASISEKYAQRQAAMVPFYIAPPEGATALRKDLGIKGDGLELVAINTKRRWWKRFVAAAYGVEDMENWIDSIRLGEGNKEEVPKAVMKEPKEEPKAEMRDKASHEEL